MHEFLFLQQPAVDEIHGEGGPASFNSIDGTDQTSNRAGIPFITLIAI